MVNIIKYQMHGFELGEQGSWWVPSPWQLETYVHGVPYRAASGEGFDFLVFGDHQLIERVSLSDWDLIPQNHVSCYVCVACQDVYSLGSRIRSCCPIKLTFASSPVMSAIIWEEFGNWFHYAFCQMCWVLTQYYLTLVVLGN